MERLTYRDENGKALARLPADCSAEEKMEYGRASLDRLAAYEDIGTPEEVAKLKAERDAAIRDIENLCTTYYEKADDYDQLADACREYCVHGHKIPCFEADTNDTNRCVKFKWRGLEASQ